MSNYPDLLKKRYDLMKKFGTSIKFNKKIVTTILNCYLALSVAFFLIHLFAPIIGGKLLYSAVVKYGSWIGMALTLKFIFKKLQNKIRLKFVEWIFRQCKYIKVST